MDSSVYYKSPRFLADQHADTRCTKRKPMKQRGDAEDFEDTRGGSSLGIIDVGTLSDSHIESIEQCIPTRIRIQIHATSY